MHILKISRLEGLTDGIFAIAMTILALDLRLPTYLTKFDLSTFLLSDIVTKLLVYAGSFVILGTLWVAMSFQTGFLERLNRPYLWTHVLYLMIICIVPFSAFLVSTYPHNDVSISFYAINLLCANLTQYLIIECARFFKLNNASYTDMVRRVSLQRVFIAPIFYIASLVIAHWSASLAFIFLLAPIVVYMVPGKIDQYNT